jgi:hypothetical protein
MNREMLGMVGLAVVTFAVALGACSSAGHGAGGAGTTGSGMGTTVVSSSFHCCINADAYQCPGQAALDQCSGGNPETCFTKCGTDPMCISQCTSMLGNPDPSQCTKVNQPVGTWCSGTMPGTGSSGGPPPALCHGQACQFDSDCPNGQNCDSATGHCFDLSAYCVGNPCQFDSDCPDNEGCDTATSTCFAK